MSLKKLKVFALIFVIGLQAKTPTIMLSPSGDASDKGRSLSDGFERGATRQLAEAIKKELETETDTRIILTHNAGEHITQEQKANFANRLNVDIYIALTITPDDHLSISPYYYKAEPFTPSMPQRLTFYPVKKAYLRSIEQTQKYIKNSLIPQAYQTMFDIFKPIGLPIKLLEGILAPAFVFEIGIKKTGDILTYVEPLSKAISKMIGDDNDNNKA